MDLIYSAQLLPRRQRYCRTDIMIHFENAAPVKLKGVGGGLWVTLDVSRPQELLIAEIDKLFGKLKHLAVNASVIIDMGMSRVMRIYFP